MTAPKAFLSHATEDKDRFAVEFARTLRTKGIDVWLDQWEIKAGDSLVRKVFTEGISESSVFIIVISPISVQKPWVSEELDAAVVQKLNSQTKIIPVVLDDAQVPAPLRHLLWVSVERDGFDGAVDKVVQSVFDLSGKPAIGPGPAYMGAQPVASLADNAQDNLVLNLIFNSLAEDGPGRASQAELVEAGKELDLTPQMIEDSVAVLEAEGKLKLHRTFGGWFITGVSDNVTLTAYEAQGVDVAGAQRRLLAQLAADPGWVREFEGLPKRLIDAMIGVFRANGMLRGTNTYGGGFLATEVTVSGRRWLRAG